MWTRRRTWWVVGSAVAAVAVAAYCSRERPLEVETAVVSRGTLRVTIDEEGTTRVRGHEDVNAPVSGRWVPASVHVGDPVVRGGAIGLLYPAPLDPRLREEARAGLGAAESAVGEADARVAAAQAALDEAERTLGRIEKVATAGGASRQEVDRARTAAAAGRNERDAARKRAEAARFDVARARASLDARGGDGGAALVVRAPIRGVLLRVHEEHEHVVSAGAPLAQVGDPADLEIVVPLLTADAARVQPGAVVRVTTGPGSDTLVARVRLVEPAAYTKLSPLGVEEQRVNVIARFARAQAGLGDGFRVDARVTVAELPDAVIVPVSALVRHGEEWSTFVVDAGRARSRALTLGARAGDAAQVLGGLEPGTRVVAYPGERVVDGSRVRP